MASRINPHLHITRVLDRPLSLCIGLLRGDVYILTLDGLERILGGTSSNLKSLELIAYTKRNVLGLGNRAVTDDLTWS